MQCSCTGIEGKKWGWVSYPVHGVCSGEVHVINTQGSFCKCLLTVLFCRQSIDLYRFVKMKECFSLCIIATVVFLINHH